MEVSTSDWKDYFTNWPAGLPRRGILVTAFGEQIPFAGFLVSKAFLLIQRRAPDSLGARTLLMAYDQVTALKITDVVKHKMFESIGFEGSLPQG